MVKNYAQLVFCWGHLSYAQLIPDHDPRHLHLIMGNNSAEQQWRRVTGGGGVNWRGAVWHNVELCVKLLF